MHSAGIRHLCAAMLLAGGFAVAAADREPSEYAEDVGKVAARFEALKAKGGESKAPAGILETAQDRAADNAVYPLLYSAKKRMTGVLEDWNDIPFAGRISFLNTSHATLPEGLEAYFKASVSDDTLYLLAVVKDKVLNFGFRPAYNSDCFEFFLDPFFARRTTPDDSHIQVFVTAADREGTKFAAEGKIPVAVKPVPVPGGWGVEMAIPLENDYFKASVYDGLAIGFNICYNNNDNGTARQQKIGWSGIDRDDGSWNNPSLFGVLEVVRSDARSVIPVREGKAIEQNRQRRRAGETIADQSILAKYRPSPAVVRGFQSGNLRDGQSFRDMVNDWGANAVRLQLHGVGPRPTWTPENFPVFLDRLEKIVQQARAAGIKVIPVAFEVPCELGGREMWEVPGVEEGFRKYWVEIARRLAPYRDTIWAYDLYNEPLARAQLPYAPVEWRQMALNIIRAIREVDQECWIVYEVGPGGGWRGFEDLTPLPDPRIIYSLHFYEPGAFTHQGIAATQLQDPGLLAKAQEATGVRYPGVIGGIRWDRDHLEKSLQPVIDFQKKYNVPIFVGEFSVIAWAPVECSTQYLKDVTGIFDKYGWSWTYHAFREYQGWSLEHEDGVVRANAMLKIVPESARGKVMKEVFKRNVKQ